MEDETTIADHPGIRSLQFWHFVVQESVRTDGPDLTSRQLAVLLSVYLTEPPHTVRGLAEEIDVGKPVITRAVNSLIEAGFVKRVRDEKDRRNVFIWRTVKGAVYLSELADRIVEAKPDLHFPLIED